MRGLDFGLNFVKVHLNTVLLTDFCRNLYEISVADVENLEHLKFSGRLYGQTLRFFI